MAVNCSGTYSLFTTTITELSDDFDAFSWAFWMKSTGGGNYGLMYQFDAAAANAHFITENAGTITMTADRATSVATSVVASAITANVWAHVAGTWSLDSAPKIYINGVEGSYSAGRTAGAGVVFDPDGVFYTGSIGVGNFLNGSLAEVGYWKRELTQAEITSLSTSDIFLL